LGIRVGDRVQISGVTGEVVEIGLVRLHLMEMSGGVPEIPTGRVVAFSNSIVFQPGVGLFKQIPGTTFRWHEITLTLAPGTDYTVARERLQSATDKVFADYQESMTEQSKHMEETFSATSVKELRPKIRLNFTATGLEAVIRYPVDSKHSSEIDERVSSELLHAVDQEPKLSTADAAPGIRLKTNLLVG
jgi:small-conductance mechanosensitive channel